VFHQGRIQQIADPQTIYERPANLFVASFIGESNRLPARVVEMQADGCCAVRIADGAVLRGRAGGRCDSEGPAIVAVRPERIAVTAAGSADAQHNALEGVVEETIFLGGHLRVRLKCAAGEVIAAVPIQSAATVPPAGGAAVARWPAASTVIFPA
jgi:putative spermidine/putrescine transport system ATP-binding protein